MCESESCGVVVLVAAVGDGGGGRRSEAEANVDVRVRKLWCSSASGGGRRRRRRSEADVDVRVRKFSRGEIRKTDGTKMLRILFRLQPNPPPPPSSSFVVPADRKYGYYIVIQFSVIFSGLRGRKLNQIKYDSIV